jgi:excinuclease UvrABC nuclease subunit
MILKRMSILTGNVSEMEIQITEEELNAYLNGNECIQNVFPHLNADEREFIMTGITSEEWEEM